MVIVIDPQLALVLGLCVACGGEFKLPFPSLNLQPPISPTHRWPETHFVECPTCDYEHEYETEIILQGGDEEASDETSGDETSDD